MVNTIRLSRVNKGKNSFIGSGFFSDLFFRSLKTNSISVIEVSRGEEKTFYMAFKVDNRELIRSRSQAGRTQVGGRAEKGRRQVGEISIK
jgi:hypothetical protein